MEDLPKCDANYVPLTPLSFLEISASVYPDKAAVIYGHFSYTWAQTYERCRRLGSALVARSIAKGDRVAVVATNVPAMYEMQFGVAMAAAVVTPINYRLDAHTMSVILRHSGAKAVFVDSGFMSVVQEALSMWPSSQVMPWIVVVQDRVELDLSGSYRLRAGEVEYEEFLAAGDPKFDIIWPTDESFPISLNYTSGTTASPKGVLYSHRSGHLNALASVIQTGMHAGKNVMYLWTLPMFHCNGWCLTWGLAAIAGTSICLRQPNAGVIYDSISKHKVTHMGGAPIVLNMIVSALPHEKKALAGRVDMIVGAAPPPPAILAKMEQAGFHIIHGYGLTEVGGPATICDWKSEWDLLPLEQRAVLKARQGVRHIGLSDVAVMDPKSMTLVPSDGKSLGEVMLRGNTVMLGYFKDEKATSEAFHGGWFHTGDIGVMHPDRYIELKDRSKDIIISGGENISSIEVESVLFTHPHILEAAVVAQPDERWGEIPCAFVTLKQGSSAVSQEEIILFCRKLLPHYMVPKTVVFSHLPKTSTGKVQKSQLRAIAKALKTPIPSKL